jgi:hypothetical protein
MDMQQPNYKLLYYRNEGELELYNTEADPLEQDNLFHDANPDRCQYDGIVQDMLLTMVNFFMDTESCT